MTKHERYIQEQMEYRKPKRVVEVVCLGAKNNIFPVCPTCRKILDREYLGYCYICGQNLSWWGFGKAKIVDKNQNT